MESRRGKLIVIEGTDGSGKRTQLNFLAEKLKNIGLKIATGSFPQYGKKSAGLVEEYLNGKYGRPEEVNPYAASLFYALDRFDAAFEIRKLIDGGHTVLLDRYADSNAGHQGGKIRDESKRAEFLSWLYETEYEILRVPRPDLVIILNVPAEIGYELIGKKEQRLYIDGKGKRDGHESDIEHLKNAAAAYLWLANQYPENHKVVECVKDGRMLAPEEISEKIFSVVKNMLEK